MKWKVLLVVGAVAAGVIIAARRRNLQLQADAELWAEATDPVPSSHR
ncbi:DLW-39 family protein [Microlunatus speluncae]|nr:DLW-39 family protein [Microlunatus speluncae]